MKNSTRAKSSQQEKRIAKAMGGRQVVGSGSTPFLKGDVIAGKLFIEAKTKMEPSKSISVKKEWLEKAKAQSLGMTKEYYIIEDVLMEDLYKSREALRAVIEELGGLELKSLCGIKRDEELKRIILEVLK